MTMQFFFHDRHNKDWLWILDSERASSGHLIRLMPTAIKGAYVCRYFGQFRATQWNTDYAMKHLSPASGIDFLLRDEWYDDPKARPYIQEYLRQQTEK